MSCGSTHFAVIDSANLLYVAGDGISGCLGLGDNKDRKCLVQVKYMAKLKVTFYELDTL